jgi:hypothetical protein
LTLIKIIFFIPMKDPVYLAVPAGDGDNSTKPERTNNNAPTDSRRRKRMICKFLFWTFSLVTITRVACCLYKNYQQREWNDFVASRPSSVRVGHHHGHESHSHGGHHPYYDRHHGDDPFRGHHGKKRHGHHGKHGKHPFHGHHGEHGEHPFHGHHGEHQIHGHHGEHGEHPFHGHHSEHYHHHSSPSEDSPSSSESEDKSSSSDSKDSSSSDSEDSSSSSDDSKDPSSSSSESEDNDLDADEDADSNSEEVSENENEVLALDFDSFELSLEDDFVMPDGEMDSATIEEAIDEPLVKGTDDDFITYYKYDEDNEPMVSKKVLLKDIALDSVGPETEIDGDNKDYIEEAIAMLEDITREEEEGEESLTRRSLLS